MKLTESALKSFIKEQLKKLREQNDPGVRAYIRNKKRRCGPDGKRCGEGDWGDLYNRAARDHQRIKAKERQWLIDNSPEGTSKNCIQLGCRETYTGAGGLQDLGSATGDPVATAQTAFGEEDPEGLTAAERRERFGVATGAKKCSHCNTPYHQRIIYLNQIKDVALGHYNRVQAGMNPFGDAGAPADSGAAKLADLDTNKYYRGRLKCDAKGTGCPPGFLCTDRQPGGHRKPLLTTCRPIGEVDAEKRAERSTESPHAADLASIPTIDAASGGKGRNRKKRYTARVGRARRNGLTILRKAGFDSYQDFYDKLEETDLLNLLDPYGPDKKWGPRHSDALKQFQKGWDLVPDEDDATKVERDEAETKEIEAVHGEKDRARHETAMGRAQELFKLMDGLTGFEAKKKVRSIIDEAEEEGTLGALYSAYDEVLQKAFKIGVADPEDGDLIQWLKDDSLPDSAKRVNAAVERSAETGTPLGDRVYDALMKDFLKEFRPRPDETFEEWVPRFRAGAAAVKEKYKKITGKSETPKEKKYHKIVRGWLDSRGWEATLKEVKGPDSGQLQEFSSFPEHQKLFEGWSRYLKS